MSALAEALSLARQFGNAPKTADILASEFKRLAQLTAQLEGAGDDTATANILFLICNIDLEKTEDELTSDEERRLVIWSLALIEVMGGADASEILASRELVAAKAEPAAPKP